MEKGRLWQKIIGAIHGHSRSYDIVPCLSNAAGVWKTITKLDKEIETKEMKPKMLIQGALGNGNLISFWSDNWMGEGCFKDIFPRLFKIESNKKTRVASRLGMVNGCNRLQWEWKKKNFTQDEEKELDVLTKVLQTIKLENKDDEWRWELDRGHGFSVRSMRIGFDKYSATRATYIFQWTKWLPLKVNVFGWRALRDRLPTKQALLIRNVGLSDDICPMCESRVECLDHLLTGCQYSNDIWFEVEKWCKIKSIVAFSVKDLLFYHEVVTGSSKKKALIQVVFLVVCWEIWKERNKRVFQTTKRSPMELMVNIKEMRFLWVKHRANLDDLDERVWSEFTF